MHYNPTNVWTWMTRYGLASVEEEGSKKVHVFHIQEEAARVRDLRVGSPRCRGKAANTNSI